MSILIAENHTDCAESLAMMLRLRGYADVRIACDGVSAVREAESHWPDVALLELSLPGKTGREVAEWLSGNGGPKPLLVAISSHSSDQNTLGDCPFDHFFLKPYDPEALCELLDGHLKLRRAK